MPKGAKIRVAVASASDVPPSCSTSMPSRMKFTSE